MPTRKEILKELGLISPEERTTGETTTTLPPTTEPFGIPTTEVPAGLEKFGDSIIAMAIKGLEMALAIFGSSSEKGQAILSALNKLSKVVDEKELTKAEMAFETMFTGMPFVSPAPTPSPTPPSTPPTTPPTTPIRGETEIPETLIRP